MSRRRGRLAKREFGGRWEVCIDGKLLLGVLGTGQKRRQAGTGLRARAYREQFVRLTVRRTPRMKMTNWHISFANFLHECIPTPTQPRRLRPRTELSDALFTA